MAQLMKTHTLSSTIPLNQWLLRPIQPLTCCVRYARKLIPIKTWREPDFDKKLLLAACEPVKRRDTRPTWERCHGPIIEPSVLTSTPHPYDELIGAELKEKISKARMIVFYHANIQMKSDIIINMNALTDAGFSYQSHNRMVYRLACENTKFAPLIPVLTAVKSNTLAISNEIDIPKFMAADKKTVNLYLLFAYVYGRLVSKVELSKLARMPDLKKTQGQLLGTLSSPASTLAFSINHQLSLLSRGLDARAQQLQTTSPSPDSKNELS